MVGAGTDRTKAAGEGGPAVVLVRPQLAVNIGTAARAMANFGLSDLRLVRPKGGWPPEGAYAEMAEAAASGAVSLLARARVFETIEAAVADLKFLWATTARERGQGKRVLLPKAAMRDTAAAIALDECHGILFGPERTGLTNDEVAIADAIVTFPVSAAYGSLNLAQAVLLMGYEWHQAADKVAAEIVVAEEEPETPPAPALRSPRARREDVLSFFEFLEAELTGAGYFRPDGKQPVMRRNLRNIFHRMEMSQQDVRTLRGAMVRLVEGRRSGDRPPRVRRAEPDAG